ncbi:MULTISPECIES: ATP-grasp domain-containing protein [Spirosoma]|uniref:ATP-grasp domain-containing protein n=1 Tax=Spirosoma sordidisoli TaxID=2502893 RepID=A0A4Q2UNR1_9BACT|nr:MULTISPECIES: hypothetical protein [Spirosoma]RYC68449.1 hypothetical protein EQG79_19005 [Spirosoma sordidisoli]
MILVLSQQKFEPGTDPVLNWLLYNRIPFVKVTLQDLVDQRVSYTVDVDNQDVFINGRSVRNDVEVIWHRRFIIDLHRVSRQIEGGSHPQLRSELELEIRELLHCLSAIFRDKTWLTPFDRIGVSKLTMLQQARAHGLAVPRSKVLTARADVAHFLADTPTGLISKPLSDGRSYYLHEGDTYVVFTNLITAGSLNELPERFFPSLFQERVPARYELRVFYLDGNCYTTAILNSTADKNVDRKLDSTASSTHYVPYRLPDSVNWAVDAFMRASGLNTGSLDFIRSDTGAYVFLEVNPVGQYMAESEKTNYKLDRVIATWLQNQTAHACS